MITKKLEKEITRFLRKGLSAIFTDFAKDRVSWLEDRKTGALTLDVIGDIYDNIEKLLIAFKTLLQNGANRYCFSAKVIEATGLWEDPWAILFAVFDEEELPLILGLVGADRDGQLVIISRGLVLLKRCQVTDSIA